MKRIEIIVVATLALLMINCASANATIYYVATTGNDFNDGLSWSLAQSDLQATIHQAVSGDQVWVASGTYTGNFVARDGISVYGGFVGNETSISQRNISVNPTILDAAGNGTVYTVPSYAIQTNTLDGFIVQNATSIGLMDNGNDHLVISNCVFSNNSDSNDEGGALFVLGTLVLSNCTFSNNTANGEGGAAFCNGVTTISGCTFNNNSSTYGGAGAIAANNVLTVTGCAFSNNLGGAIAATNGGNSGTSAAITDCAFTDNKSGDGYAIYVGGETVTIANCTFTGNVSDFPSESGAILRLSCPTVLVKNCLIVGSGSTPNSPSGIEVPGTIYETIVNNTIVNTNVALSDPNFDGTLNVANNIFEGNYGDLVLPMSGEYYNAIVNSSHNDHFGNVNFIYQHAILSSSDTAVDPQFVNNANSDYHLTPGSPMIDTGDDAFVNAGETDLDGNARIQGANVDVGCYELPQSFNATPISLAVASDGDTRLLWNISNEADLWRLDPNGNFVSDVKYGPFDGWTPSEISSNSSSGTSLLWRNASGEQDIWQLDGNGNYVADGKFGPFTGWSIPAIGTGGADGNTRLLWANNDSADIWVVSPSGGYVTDQVYGPDLDWTPVALGTASDNTSLLLWTNGNGTADLWTLTPSANYASDVLFGPFAGWTASDIAVAPDGTSRMTWTNTLGEHDIWILNASGSFVADARYAPVNNFELLLTALAPDDSGRLLWLENTGLANLWSTDSSTGQNVLSSVDFGPF